MQSAAARLCGCFCVNNRRNKSSIGAVVARHVRVRHGSGMYAFGMEEEYFLFDAKSRHAVRRVDKKFLLAAQKRLGDRVMTEMLQSQLEVATPPCATFEEAHAHLAHYRRALGEMAAQHRLGIAAMGTFPLAYWPEQTVTPKSRYGAIIDDLQMIGYRNMLCGMHVHVS